MIFNKSSTSPGPPSSGKVRKEKLTFLGCGTGRHSIELTRRGYQVSGVDLSESQLAMAREEAENPQLNIQVEGLNGSFTKYKENPHFFRPLAIVYSIMYHYICDTAGRFPAEMQTGCVKGDFIFGTA